MYALLGEGDRRSGGLTVGADRPVDRRFRTVNLDDRVNLAVREHQALVIRQREGNGGVAVIIAGRAVSGNFLGILRACGQRRPVDDLRVGGEFGHPVARCVLGRDGDGVRPHLGEGDGGFGGLAVRTDRPVGCGFLAVDLDGCVGLAVDEHQALVIRQREGDGGVAAIIASRAVLGDRLCIGRGGDRVRPVDDDRVGGEASLVARCVLGGDGDGMRSGLGEGNGRSRRLLILADRPFGRDFRVIDLDGCVGRAVLLDHQALIVRQGKADGGTVAIVAGRAVLGYRVEIYRFADRGSLFKDDLVALHLHGAVARGVIGDEMQRALQVGLNDKLRLSFFVDSNLTALALNHLAVLVHEPVFKLLHAGGGILRGQLIVDLGIEQTKAEDFKNLIADLFICAAGKSGGRGLVDFDLAALDRVRDVAVHVAQVDILFGIGAVRRDGGQRLRPRRIAPQLIVDGGKLPALRGGNGDGAGVPAAVVLRFARHDIGRVRGLRVGNL